MTNEARAVEIALGGMSFAEFKELAVPQLLAQLALVNGKLRKVKRHGHKAKLRSAKLSIVSLMTEKGLAEAYKLTSCDVAKLISLAMTHDI
jgi:hypothetical protein